MKKMYNNLLLGLVSFAYICGTFLLIVLPGHPYIIIATFIVAVLGTVILTLMNREKIQELMSSTYGKNISSNIIGFFLLFCIMALVNYIAFKRPAVYDLSDRRLNSLTDQTYKVLSSVNEKTEVIFFAAKEHEQNIRNFLKLYSNKNNHLELKYIDPVLRPDLVSSHGVTISPSVVIKNSKRSVVVAKMQELAMTNGLIKVLRQNDPEVCFSYTPLMEETKETGFTGLLHILKNSAFKLKVVDLLKVKEIPSSCQVFTILAQQNDFMTESLEKIKSYYKRGGVVLTGFFPMMNGDKVPNLRKFYSDNGLSIFNDIVIDRKNSIEGSMGSVPIVKAFDSRGVNTNLQGQIFFPLTSSVHPVDRKNKNFISLASSSKTSWAEKTFQEIASGSIQFDDKDILGPIDLAGAILVDDRPRLIALGNSSLVSNKFYQFQANFNYFVNIIHWSVGQDLLTSARAAVFKEIPLFIGNTHKRVIFYFSIIALPLTLLLIAVIQFRRRRMA
jgi:hypothetical protein